MIHKIHKNNSGNSDTFRCRWPSGLRRRSAAARLRGSRVRIPLSAWMSVSCVCCVSIGLCDRLITRPEESYLLSVSVSVCDPAASTVMRSKPQFDCCGTEDKPCVAIPNAVSSVQQVYVWNKGMPITVEYSK